MNGPIDLLKKQIRELSTKKRNDFIKQILDVATFDEINNKSPKSTKKIGIVVPELHRYTGGHTSIVRLGTYLSAYGYDVDYISYTNQNLDEMRDVIRKNYNLARGECIDYNKIDKDYDVVIATNWVSVYYAKRLPGYKMYLVQDYEPYFFPQGEEYVLAEQTYKLGFHIVSLGKWNIKEIKKNIDRITGKIDFIDFPYEPREYKYEKRNFEAYKNKKSYIIAVYTKSNGKRLHNIIEYILKNASSSLRQQGISLDIRFFGMEKGYEVSTGTNLGKLTQSEMSVLFNNADFGMTASLTNISLVPFEMIASGLPVIEIKDGSYDSFMSVDTALLIDYDYKNFVEKFIELISFPDYLKKMSKKAYDEISQLSWEKSSKQFCKILDCIIDAEKEGD